MALSDLAVFNEWAYDSMTEVLAQQLELFNEASAGTIILAQAANVGDYNERAFFKKMTGLVRRRNSYGSGAVSAIDLQQLIDTSVKVAAGTPPVNLPPSQFRWIQMNPEVAGAAMGQQLAVEMLADMVNTAVGAGAAALAQTTAVVNDISGGSGGAEFPSFIELMNTAQKFGDRSGAVQAWVMHSTPLTKLYSNALTNANQLFTYGNVSVIADPFGRRFIVSDIPGLVVAGSPNKYRTLGLVPGAIRVEENGDFDMNDEKKNGDENIQRTIQSEWTYNASVKGYSWDKGNGGHSPTTAALLTSTNWDKYATSDKDAAGVLLLSK